MKTFRYGLIGVAIASGLALMIVGVGCGPGSTPTGAPASATRGAGDVLPTTRTSATTVGADPTTAATEPAPATTEPAAATPEPTVGSAPPPVDVAIISALSADSVSWTDGKLVPAPANNVMVQALTGAAHQHTAPLSPNIRYYTFQGTDGLALDDHGNGTVLCDRQAEAALVLADQELSPRLTFDSQGRVLTMRTLPPVTAVTVVTPVTPVYW